MLPHHYSSRLAEQIARRWERTRRRRRAHAAAAVPLQRDLGVRGRHVARRRARRDRPQVLGEQLLAGDEAHRRHDGLDARLARDPRRATPRTIPTRPGHQLRLCAAAPMPPDTDRIWRERFGCETFSGGYGLTEASLISMLAAGEPNKPGAAGKPNIARVRRPHRRRRRRRGAGRRGRRDRVPARTARTSCSPATGTGPRRRSRRGATSGSTPATSAGSTTTASSTSSTARRTTCAGGARTSRASRWSRCCSATRRSPTSPCTRCRATLGEDDVKVTAVLQDGATVTEEELCRWVAERVPYFAIPRYIEFRADLPRNPVGRVLKYELRDEGVTAHTWDREAAGRHLRTALNLDGAFRLIRRLGIRSQSSRAFASDTRRCANAAPAATCCSATATPAAAAAHRYRRLPHPAPASQRARPCPRRSPFARLAHPRRRLRPPRPVATPAVRAESRPPPAPETRSQWSPAAHARRRRLLGAAAGRAASALSRSWCRSSFAAGFGVDAPALRPVARGHEPRSSTARA